MLKLALLGKNSVFASSPEIVLAQGTAGTRIVASESFCSRGMDENWKGSGAGPDVMKVKEVLGRINQLLSFRLMCQVEKKL